MKNIIRITLTLALIAMCIIPTYSTHANTKTQRETVKGKKTTIDFMATNPTGSAGYVWLRNTVTEETYYFPISANSGSNPVKIGELPASDDQYEGSVTITSGPSQDIQLYYEYQYNTSYLYATGLNIACGACAMVILGYH